MNTEIKDERAGLPSASSMEAFVNCPGREQLIKAIMASGEYKQVQSAVAQSGVDMHAGYETGDTEGLEVDESEIVQRLEAMTTEVVSQWQQAHFASSNPLEYREARLWIRDRHTLEPLASAKVDRAYVCQNHGLVIDAKTGFLETTPSERNWQVRTQALCLLHEHPEIEVVRAGILASRLSNKIDLTDYTRADLMAVERELIQAIWRSKQEGAPRRPGTWCKYCPASQGGMCRERVAMSQVELAEFRGLEKVDIALKIGKLTPAGLLAVWKAKGNINAVLDGVDARLKAMPDDQLAALGLSKKPGSERRSCTDPQKALTLLTTALEPGQKPLFTMSEAMGLFKPSFGDMEKAVAASRKVKLAAAKEIVAELWQDVTEKKQSAPSIEEI